MAIKDFIIGAAVVEAGTEATGSYALITCISGAKETGGSLESTIFETISFGPSTQPESAYTASSALTNYSHSLGTHFEPNIHGPIARFKVTKGKVLAYFTEQ